MPTRELSGEVTDRGAFRHVVGRDAAALVVAAKDVLDRNWRGRSTVPSARLYPHQWSWDSAFIAIGRSWYDQERAQQEIESLLEAQWTDGRIPHLLFNPDVPRDAYFPGPDFWSDRDAGGPQGPETSGLIQPPLHARAVLEIVQHAQDPGEALAFAKRVYPKLTAWHHYLLGERDPARIGLSAIVHPWESGLDNSPAWEVLLADLTIPSGALPAYERRDLVHANAADRPTDAAYDRFVYLASAYRSLHYADAAICDQTPFLIVGPLVNAVLVWSSLALAEIAQAIGEDPEPHRAAASRVRRATQRWLWDRQDQRYYTRDLRGGRFMREPSILSFMPILDPGLPASGVRAILRDLEAPQFHPPEEDPHFVIPSYDLTGAWFDPRRYWRGPVWINTDWLVWRGLLQHGQQQQADHVATSMLTLVKQSGFREYFNPRSGDGYGDQDFSWTAALIIDLIHRLDAFRAAGR